jgi:hypothetical protein
LRACESNLETLEETSSSCGETDNRESADGDAVRLRSVSGLSGGQERDRTMNVSLIPHLLQAPASPSEEDDFNVVGDEIFATFSAWASWLSDGNPFAPTPIVLLPAASDGSSGTQGSPDSIMAVTSGGITINLIFDTAALAAPQSFRDGIQQAVAIIAAAISDKITVNIKIDYSGTGHGASAGPDKGLYEPYSWVRANLINNATPGDTTFNALTAGSTIQGQTNVAVWNAQLKLWGVIGANDTATDDGAATFATDIDPNLLVGVALHELTHAMGRVPYGASSQPDIFDFYRFTSPGTRLFLGGATAPAAYFSLDGGNTKVADYGRTSDPSDFLNSGVQGPNDPFNEFYNGGTSQQLTAADLKQLDALGFHLTSAAPGSLAISDASVAEGNSGTTVETFVVTRTGGTAAFDVSFSTADGSATVADHDYVAASGTLHFSAGVNTQTISITINGDTTPESDEAFFVNLSGATNGASVSDSQGVGTIVNDDTIVPSGLTSTLHDFNGDGKADLLWRNDSGAVATWDMNDRSYNGFAFATVSNDWHIAGTGDFNGDGKADILWRNDSGAVATWDMNDRSYNGFAFATVSNDWHIAGTGDFNGDGMSDILWRNDSGAVATWNMNDRSSAGAAIGNASNDWHIAGTGDFNGDGKTDILWRNDNGAVATWDMNDRSSAGAVIGTATNDWHIAGTGDFNGDGKADILWRNDSGAVATWDMNDRSYSGLVIANVSNDWHIAGTGDFNGDGKADILWRNDNGAVATWDMDDRSYSGLVIATATNDWHIV